MLRSYDLLTTFIFPIYDFLIPFFKATVITIVIWLFHFDSSFPFQSCWNILAPPLESEIMDGFWCSRSLNDRIGLLNMIGSFASGTTASIVAKNWTNNSSQPFKELQGSNSEFKLITSKSITRKILGLFWNNFRTNLEPFWDHFGTIWHNFWTILGPF